MIVKQLKFFIALLVFFASLFAGFAPRLLVILIIAFAFIAFCILYFRRHAKMVLPKHDALLWTFMLFIAYIGLSLLWSINLGASVNKVLLTVLLVVSGYAGHQLFPLMDDLQLHRTARGIVIGVLTSLIFLLFESLTNFAVLNLIAGSFPGLVKTYSNPPKVPPYYLNAQIVMLTLFLWPALLVAQSWRNRTVGIVFATLMVGMLLPIIIMTESETAKVAGFLGLVSFIGALVVPKVIHWLATAFWIVAVVGVIPLVTVLHVLEVQNNLTALPDSARERIYIWKQTADQIPQNLLFGIGIRSDRYYSKKAQSESPSVPSKIFVLHKGWHSHNNYLQTWYELGMVGASFLLAIGLLLLRRIHSLGSELKPYAYAAFASFGAVSAFGYGLWQSWLLSGECWMVIFLLVAFNYHRRAA